jgi:uncharacterized RDD family membrane protein YckC
MNGPDDSAAPHRPRDRGPAGVRGARVTLRRRLAAIVYDCFALIGVCAGAGALVIAARGGRAVEAGSLWFTGYLAFAIYAYFALSWRRGQTLGMRSWRLRLVDCASGSRVSWRQTALRFVLALLGWLPAGMGYWRSLWDRDGRGWHDAGSGTCLERV